MADCPSVSRDECFYSLSLELKINLSGAPLGHKLCQVWSYKSSDFFLKAHKLATEFAYIELSYVSYPNIVFMFIW